VYAYTVVNNGYFYPHITLHLDALGENKPGLILDETNKVTLPASLKCFSKDVCPDVLKTIHSLRDTSQLKSNFCTKCGEPFILSVRRVAGSEMLYIYDHPNYGLAYPQITHVDNITLVDDIITPGNHIRSNLSKPRGFAFIRLQSILVNEDSATHLYTGRSSKSVVELMSTPLPKARLGVNILSWNITESIIPGKVRVSAALQLDVNCVFGICGEGGFPDELIVWNGTKLKVLNVAQKEL